MARPPIMDPTLQEEAMQIMERRGITCVFDTFKMPKTGSRFTWDTHHTFRFFTGPQRLNGSCAVIEMYMCHAPRFAPATPTTRVILETFPGVTGEEWTTIFKWHVRDILRRNGRRMALATLIASQKPVIPFLREAGFDKVSDGFNPATRHKVTMWALSI